LEQAQTDAKAAGMALDTVLLGCTHYPLLRALLREALPKDVTILDSAESTAQRVRQELGKMESLASESPDAGANSAICHFFATDSVEKFRTLGSRFLGRPIEKVDLIDLGG
jgi:glutamate racemase